MTDALSWSEFAASIGEILNLPEASVSPDARLVEDLGADSVALAELVAFLLLDCGMEELAQDLDRRDWRGITAGDVYREYSTERASR